MMHTLIKKIIKRFDDLLSKYLKWNVGRAGFEPAKVTQRIYSPSSLAA